MGAMASTSEIEPAIGRVEQSGKTPGVILSKRLKGIENELSSLRQRDLRRWCVREILLGWKSRTNPKFPGSMLREDLLIATVDRSFGLNLRERLVDERWAQSKGVVLAGGSIGISLRGGISVFDLYQTSQQRSGNGRGVIISLVDLNDRLIGTFFTKSKNKYERAFAEQGKAINDKVRLYAKVGAALVHAREQGGDPFAAIEAVVPWESFSASVKEAAELARDQDFDALSLMGEHYPQLRRYGYFAQRLEKVKLAALGGVLANAGL